MGEKEDEGGALNGRSLLPHQRIPRTAQCLAQAQHRRQKDVDVASFDLLDGSNVQIYQFGELLLGDFSAHSLAAEVHPEGFDLRCLFGI